jgi:hypothetical protein
VSDDDETPPRPSRAPWIVALACVIGLAAWQREGIADLALSMVGADVPYRPQHPAQLDAIDLAAVHGDLWTTWVIAAAGDDADARRDAETALRSAIAGDANLTELFDELAASVTTPKLAQKRARERVMWIVRAWNDYLDANGAGWFLDASIRLQPEPMFFAMAYRVLGDGKGTIDAEPARVRVLARVDSLNLRELYSGYVSTAEQGAMVLADRTRALALDRTWPAMGDAPGDTGDAALWRAFGAAITREATAALSAESIAVLRATASVRAQAVLAHDAIVDRRDCGSRFIITDLPWNGYEPDTVAGLDRWIEDGPCPAITQAEIDRLREATTVLRNTSGLAAALSELARWRARGIATHELRHVGDDLDLEDPDDDALPCAICQASTPLSVRAEVSAYLAELAWSPAPAVELFDVCVTKAQGESAHARAAEIVLGAGGWSCSDAPPDDLATAARVLEQRAFGRSQEITVGEDIAAALRVGE